MHEIELCFFFQIALSFWLYYYNTNSDQSPLFTALNLSLSSLGATFPRPVFHSDFFPTPIESGFPGGSDGREFACNVGDLG